VSDQPPLDKIRAARRPEDTDETEQTARDLSRRYPSWAPSACWAIARQEHSVKPWGALCR
jgi:hypothetical protein